MLFFVYGLHTYRILEPDEFLFYTIKFFHGFLSQTFIFGYIFDDFDKLGNLNMARDAPVELAWIGVQEFLFNFETSRRKSSTFFDCIRYIKI